MSSQDLSAGERSRMLKSVPDRQANRTYDRIPAVRVGREAVTRGTGAPPTCSSHASYRKSLPGAGSGSPAVLVDKTTQDVDTLDHRTGIAVADPDDRWQWCWDAQAEASVRSLTVVVGHVRVQDLL